MSWIRKLFGGSSSPVPSIEAVVSAYGEVLGGGTASTVRSVSELPFGKDVIERCLLEAIDLTPENEMREQLQTSYVMLADFQDLSPEEEAAVSCFQSVITGSADEDAVPDAIKIAHSSDLMQAVTKRVAGEAESRFAVLKSRLESED